MFDYFKCTMPLLGDYSAYAFLILIVVASLAFYILAETLHEMTQRYKSMQNVAVFLYNRLEHIEQNSEKNMIDDGNEAAWTEIMRLTQKRYEVAIPTISGLMFKDPATKETV